MTGNHFKNHFKIPQKGFCSITGEQHLNLSMQHYTKKPLIVKGVGKFQFSIIIYENKMYLNLLIYRVNYLTVCFFIEIYYYSKYFATLHKLIHPILKFLVNLLII